MPVPCNDDWTTRRRWRLGDFFLSAKLTYGFFWPKGNDEIGDSIPKNWPFFLVSMLSFWGVWYLAGGNSYMFWNFHPDPWVHGSYWKCFFFNVMLIFSSLCGGDVRSLWIMVASINLVEKNSVKLRRDTNLSLNHDSGEDAKLYINHQNPQPAFLGVM